jgi:AraC family transcriptional regulator
MALKDQQNKALDFIEAHLFEALSVGDIAAASGLSAYHFSRLFSARHGESVMGYVRRRRLDVAAGRLEREPDTKLIDLALDCGFESQEAFTRAFVRQFGRPPGQFRREEAARTSISEGNETMTINLVLQESLEQRAGFSVAGVSGRFDQTNKEGIPKLWDRFIPLEFFPGRIGEGETYGICWGADRTDGSFYYMAGAPIAPDAAPPAGLEIKAVPSHTYLVFKQTLTADALHPQMRAAAEEIWSRRLQASGRTLAMTPDFELYAPGFEPGQEGAIVSYYIPVLV